MTSSRDISLARAEDANMMIAITAASVREVFNVSCIIPIFFLCGFLAVDAKRVRQRANVRLFRPDLSFL